MLPEVSGNRAETDSVPDRIARKDKMSLLFRALLAVAVFSPFTASAQAPSPVETAADYAVIMDYGTGDILFEKNAYTPMAPASMSKVMTAAIVFERLAEGSLELSDMFHVSKKAWKKGGSKMWVQVDTEISVENLLRGIIIQSGNDACIVVAENISGSEEAFAGLMNRKAKEWGLKNSTFANASGWPDDRQRMSAYDLALLARKIIHDFPEYYPLYAETVFTWEGITQENRNPLLGNVDGADGLKTGHTEESGYGLVASALRGENRRIVVLNGLESVRERFMESARLMETAFDAYTARRLFAPGDPVVSAEVFKGREKTVPLTVREPVDVFVHRQAGDVKVRAIYEKPLPAPVSGGRRAGYLEVSVAGIPGRTYPLYTAGAVDEKGFAGKVLFAAKELFVKFFPGEERADISVRQNGYE